MPAPALLVKRQHLSTRSWQVRLPLQTLFDIPVVISCSLWLFLFFKRQAQNHTSHILHSDRAGGTTGTCSASGISAYLWIALETSGLRVNGTGHYRRGNTPILGLYLHTLKGQHRGRAAAAALTLSSDALTFIGTWAHERTCGRTSHKRALMIAPESLEEKSIRFSWYTLRGGFIFVFCYFRSKAARF